MNCKVVYDGIEYSASDFEFMLASNLLPDLSVTNTSDLNEVSENTIALAALPLLSDKINSAQQEELVNWTTAEVVGYLLKNKDKTIDSKEVLSKGFESTKAILENVKDNPKVKDKIESILEIYPKLQELVTQRIENFGLDFESEDITPEDDSENHQEDKALKVNPYTKIGQEIKKQFFTIYDLKNVNESGGFDLKNDAKNVKKNWFNFPSYKSINQILPTILSYSKNLPAEYEVIKSTLLKNKESNPWFVSLFNSIDNSKNGQVKNQFARWASKAAVNLKYLQFEESKQELKLNYNNSNSGRQVDIITENWKNNLIETGLFYIDPTTNDYELDKLKAKAITENFNTFSDKYKGLKPQDEYPEELFTELSNILKDIGVDIKPSELMKMKRFLDTQGFRWLKTANANFVQFFVVDGGAIHYMIKQLSNPDKSESESFEKYNPLSDNSGARALSLLYSTFQDVAVNDSYKNSNNDTIYSYSPKKYATDQFERIKDINYLTKLSQTQFAKNSTWMESLLSEDPDVRYRFLEVFTLDYYDGAKGKGSGLNTPFDQLSKSEQEKFRLSTFQNQARMLEKKYRYGSTSYLTMSDKKTLISVQHILEDVDVNNTYDGIGPKAINLLYKVFQAEKNRIDAYNDALENKALMSKEIALGGSKFILNPWTENFTGDLNSETEVKKAIEEYYNKLIQDKIASWKELGIVKVDDKNKTTTFFDADYNKYAKKQVINDGDINKVILFAAIDYEVNTILGNLNLFQLFAGDPASYSKKTVEDTLVNIGKRLASQIAPGDSLANTQFEDIAGINGHNYTQVISDDHIYVSSSIKYLTKLLDGKEVTDKEVEDYIQGKNKEQIKSKYPNAFPYFNIEATDAQEYTTALEHAYNLYHEGKLSDKVYLDLVDKIVNNKTLTENDVKVLMQPMKPVYFNGNVVSINGKTNTYNYYDVTYIKTSSFPLLPQLTAGTELDKLRVQLEKLQDPTDSKDPKKMKLVRMVMSTGIKIGSVQKPVKVFNPDGTVNENIDFTNSTKSLTRDGYRIQLEVPLKDKNEVNRGTQPVKLIFTDLMDHKFANGKTGAEMRKEFNDLNKQLFQTQLEVLKNELQVDNDGNFNIELLREKLVKEAISRNFSVNEIQALQLVDVDTNGQFTIPLVFNNSSDKFESLLISLIDNSVRKQKQTGFSSPLGSNSGFKFQNDLKGINKNDIIWVEGYDPTKLLQQQQIVDGKVRGSQVLVPWKFRDNSGKMLNIQDFIKEVDGVKTIDHTKLPKNLLQSFGFRIPTQGLNSMAYLEIVGFLPEETGDLLIAPPEFTKQMGSDFDIDKLYSYLYSTHLTEDGVLKKYKWSSETDEQFIENYKKQLESEFQYDKLIAAIFGEKASTETLEKLLSDKKHISNLRRIKALQNEILDIHFTVLTDPSKEVQSKIVTALGFGRLSDLKTKYDNAVKAEQKDLVKISPLSSQYQTQKYLSARGGKAGTGYFSSLNVFVSVMQGLDLKFNVPVVEGEKVKWVEQKLTINKIGKGLSVNEDNTGQLKSENAVAFQSASVDDEKEQIMASLNITAETFYAIGAWVLDGHSQEAIVGIITQPIIKEYIDSINTKQDIFSGYVKNAEALAFNEIFEKYSKLTGLTVEQLNEIDFESQILTEDELWKAFNGKTKDANWALVQLSALFKFRQADSMGKSLQKVVTAFSIDSKGLGKSFIESAAKEATIDELLNSKQISNIYRLYNESIGGISSQVSLRNLNKMFNKYFPYSTTYNNTVKDLYLLYTNKNDIRQEQKEKEFRDLYNDMKSALYSKMLSLSEEDLYIRRKDLMYGDNSLAKRVNDLKRTSKNPFLMKLNVNLAKSTTEPNTISMRSIGGELFNDEDIYNGFLDLFYNEDTRQLAKDLVDYFYINGGIQRAREYSRYIPTSFLVASGYANSLRSFDLNDLSRDLGSPEEFLLQYLRNNPGKVPQLSDNDYKKNDDGSLKVTSDMFTYNDAELGSLPMPYVAITEKVDSKTKYNLYMYDKNTGNYRQIPLLGFKGKNYSTKEYGSRISAFENNSLEEVTPNIDSIKEPENQVASKLEVIPNITKTAKDDYSLLGIKPLNNIEEIKTTLSIINTGTSRALVYLLDKVNQDLQMVVHKGRNMYKPDENKVYINNGYISESRIKVAVVHEITHSVTSKIINKILEDPNTPNFDGLNESQKLAYIRLNNTYKNFIEEIFNKGIKYNDTTLTKEGLLEYKRKLDKYKAGEKVDFNQEDLSYNPFLNLKEFLAEAFSNETFQNFLNAQNYKSDKSWLQKLIEDIANFLNRFSIQNVNADSILAQALYDGFVLADVTTTQPSITTEPKGEEVKPGIYVNQAALTKEEQLELFDYLKPFLEEQASKTNKGANASKMIGLGLRWDYKSNNPEKEAMNIPDIINEGNRNKYGYYDTSINGQELGKITSRFRELMEKATGVDMTNYDGAIINLYDNDSFISSHNDVDESKSAINYPVIGINLGGTGNFSIESRDSNPKQLTLQAGTGYIFGVNGTNRQVYHRTFPGKQDSFLPELTTKLDNKTYEPGSYRVTITMRRVMPLEPSMPTSPTIKLTQPSIPAKPSEYTNHSGGAIFSDTEWDLIGREFGVENHRHYREPGVTELDSQKLKNKGIKPFNISEEDYKEGVQKATKALRMMYTDSDNKTARSSYIIRNWAQVKYSDAIFAIGTIKQPGEKVSDKKDDDRIAAIPIVKGGTGYAVQMAINEGKPVYVFDATKEGWYKYDYNEKNFVKTDTPTLTKNYAGIGSRSLSTTEAIEESLQAIYNVYEKTFGELKKPEETSFEEKINIISNNQVIDDTEDQVNEFTFPDGIKIETGNIKLNTQQQQALTNISEFITKKLMQSDVASDVDFTWTLQGYAGTGKTTITKYIVEYLKKKRVGYRAASPTHRAKEVLTDSIGEKAYTLASILGLQPGVELEEFNLQDKKFTQQTEVKIPSGGVLIIDEASMVNDELYDFVISLAGQRGTKVIFIGDDAQLKPVKQRNRAKPFRRDKHISRLTKVMRTSDGNPMPSEVLQKIRDNQSSKEDMFEHKTLLNNKGEGIIFLNNEKDFAEILKHEFTLQKFLENRFSIRAVAYTNERVRQLNDIIRTNMFGFSADKFNKGEMIMMYENIGYNFADQDYDFPNGSDNVIIDSKPIDNQKIINPVTKKIHEVKGWELTLVRAKDDSPRGQKLFVADMNTVSAEYLKDLNELKDLALKQGLSKQERGKRWSDYYKFSSSYLLTDNVYLYKGAAYVSDKEIKKQIKADNPSLSDSQISYQVGRLKAKDKSLDYSYAHTIHKSQGGTYDKVLVDENNIDIAKRFPSPDYEMINQLKYVAFSRSSKQTIVLSSKSDGRVDAQDYIDINQLDNLEDAVDFNDLLPDYSISLQKDLGMSNLEFIKSLPKEEREAYRELLRNNTFKVKCNG